MQCTLACGARGASCYQDALRFAPLCKNICLHEVRAEITHFTRMLTLVMVRLDACSVHFPVYDRKCICKRTYIPTPRARVDTLPYIYVNLSEEAKYTKKANLSELSLCLGHILEALRLADDALLHHVAGTLELAQLLPLSVALLVQNQDVLRTKLSS